MAIRAVIFDCFGVLVVDGKGMLETQFPDMRQGIHDLFMRSDYGYISSEELDAGLAELIGLSVEQYKEQFSEENVRNEAVFDWIRRLKATGMYKIGLLSNVRRAGLEGFLPLEERKELFDAEVLSGEVGMIKPAKEIFELAAERLGVEPHECVMLDDLMKNIDGAHLAGMEAILFTSVRDAEYELEQLVSQRA